MIVVQRNKAAMFCSNHNSWMDIPYLGVTIGWRNYKLISKAELGKVPILGRAIKVGGNIMLDRSNRRSQLKTLKDGMQLLKVGCYMSTSACSALLNAMLRKSLAGLCFFSLTFSVVMWNV